MVEDGHGHVDMVPYVRVCMCVCVRMVRQSLKLLGNPAIPSLRTVLLVIVNSINLVLFCTVKIARSCNGISFCCLTFHHELSTVLLWTDKYEKLV